MSGMDQDDTVLDKIILLRFADVLDYDYNFDSTTLVVLGFAGLGQSDNF